MTLAGSLSGTLALTVPGVALSGTLALQFNTGTTEVKDTLLVGGTPVSFDVPGTGSPYVQIAGKAVTLTIAGQTLSADVTITSGQDPHG